MDTLTMRRSCPDDADAMLAVARNLPAWFNQEGLEQMAQDFLVHHGAVATLAGRIVGFVTWWPSAEPEAMEITWLGVDPDLRQQGIGRRLVAVMEEEARAAGARLAVVSTLAATCDYPPYEETRRFYYAVAYTDLRSDPGHYGPGQDRLLLQHLL